MESAQYSPPSPPNIPSLALVLVAGFVVNRSLVASAVMFLFVTTAQNYLSTWSLKGKKVSNGAICLFVIAFFVHFTTVMGQTKSFVYEGLSHTKVRG